MKFINQSFEIIKQENSLQGIEKQIELAGRVCYKSEDKITNDSSKSFVERLIKQKHTSVLEHGTVYLIINKSEDIYFYKHNKYSAYTYDERFYYITTNYRVLVENNRLDDINKYHSELTDKHIKRISVRFICSRAIATELIRHRVFSFSQESTRYCNYSKSKFNNQLTFIIPSFYDNLSIKDRLNLDILFGRQEVMYLDLLEKGFKPQEVRALLPLTLKTEIIMTGFEYDWKHFFELRTSTNVHPDMLELTIPLRDKLINENMII